MEAERREETAKGQWDRGKFVCNERRDNCICPGGEEKRKLGDVMISRAANERAASEGGEPGGVSISTGGEG